MLKYIEKILDNFGNCFSRHAAYKWFVVIIVGLMVRTDTLGTTSVIRDLALNPQLYEAMNHFLRASSWALPEICQTWISTVHTRAPLMRECGYAILVGDGVKQPKEGKRSPGVKKLHQESENSSKPEYIFGHMFGAIGVLVGNQNKIFCIPLSINLQDGIQSILKWGLEKGKEIPSHVVQMIDKDYEAARTIGKSLLLLDRYFLSVPALERLRQCNESGKVVMHIVTKAKKSCIAYRESSKKKPGRGRPRKKGEAVKLRELFATKAESFRETTAVLYGKQDKIRYYCVDLLWGQKLYQKLRFVLVEYKGIQSILVSTDLALDPVAIIRLYSLRFKIECTFRELKQVIGGFCYHFWSKYMPKLNRYQKKGETAPIDRVTDPKARERIRLTVKAIEGYVQFCCIAMGITQLLSLKFSTTELKEGAFRYLRTPSRSTVSEATVAYFLRRNIFRIMAKKPYSCITQFIQEKQETLDIPEDFWAS